MTSDTDEFDDFVRSRSRSLLRSGWALTGNWASAEDLVQAALLETWRRWSTIRRTDAPEVFVYKIMARTAARWRNRRWSAEVPTAEPPESLSADWTDDAALRRTLFDALAALPPRQRAVLALRLVGDMSEAQAAAALGCSVGTVKSQANRALAKLRAVPGLVERVGEV